MTFKLKLLVTFVIYGVSLVVLSQTVLYKINEKEIKKASVKKAEEVFHTKNSLFSFYIRDINSKLNAIKSSQLF